MKKHTRVVPRRHAENGTEEPVRCLSLAKEEPNGPRPTALQRSPLENRYQRRLFQYRKSNHCLRRQYERGIDDALLYWALRYIPEPGERLLLLAKASFFERIRHKGYYLPTPAHDDLIVWLQDELIITVFFCPDTQRYLSNCDSGPYRSIILP